VRIGLCLAAQDWVSCWFSYDLVGMVAHTIRAHPDWDLRRFQSCGTWLPQVRHDTVAAALHAECDWLLFLDSDMRFPADTLEQLLARNEPVVAANYTARKAPFAPVAVRTPGERAYTDYQSSGLEAVAQIGMGVMLVQADVVRRIPPPWFMVGWHTDVGAYTGEDAYFCQQLTKAGATIWLDHDLSHDVMHLGLIEFEQSHAVKMRHTLAITEE
jgi:hypothetical protein